MTKRRKNRISWILAFVTVSVILASMMPFLGSIQGVSATSPISGYAYCKSVVITHTADGAQTYYQMQLTVYSGIGSSSTGVLYCDNYCLNWPYDIRFTNDTGTNLNYWRQSYNATVETVWVNISSIPLADATIYVDVGNASATDASNGDATFIFFDDFPGTSLDTNKWAGDTGSCSVSGGVLTLTGSGAYKFITAKVNAAGDIFCEIKAKLAVGGPDLYTYVALRITTPSPSLIDVEGNYAGWYWYSYKAGSYTVFSHTSADPGNYHTFKFLRLMTSSTRSEGFVDGASVGSTATNVPIVDLPVEIRTYGIVNNYAMSVRVCRTTLNPPTWAASGAEEALGSIIRSVPRIARIMLMSP